MKRRYDTERQIIIQHGTRPVGSLRELLDESEATGTGSGVPLLVCVSYMCFVSFIQVLLTVDFLFLSASDTLRTLFC